MNEILKHNLMPIVTIYHWDLPQPLQDIGGWTNPAMVDHFVAYARIVIRQLKNVGYWITINEPKQICIRGYALGILAPGLKSNSGAEYQCVYVLIKAHAATYRMYKKEFPNYRGNLIKLNKENKINKYHKKYYGSILICCCCFKTAHP